MNSTDRLRHCVIPTLLFLAASGAVSAQLDPQEFAKATRLVEELRALTRKIEAVSPGTRIDVPEPRHDTEGKYLSPYRADGTLTEWAQKSIGGAVGAALGHAAGDQLGKLATKELARKVPGGAVIGGLFGRKAKKALQETAAVKALGGWDYLKATSDLSFDSTMELAVYLHANHSGADPNFAHALGATMSVYPRLRGNYKRAIERAYGPEIVERAELAAEQRGPLSLGGVNATFASSGSGKSNTTEAVGQGAFLSAAVEANSLQLSGGAGREAEGLAPLGREPPPQVPTVQIDAKRHFKMKARLLNRSSRVVVPGFRVGFVVRDSVTASVAAGYQLGGTHTSGARSKTAVELAGVNNETLQEITDVLYADFLAELADTGREVITMDQLRETQRWADLDPTPAGVASPYVKEAKWLQDRVLTVYSPAELPLWWEHGNQMGDKSAFALNNWKVMTAISHELDAVVLVPTYLLSFAELQSSGNKRGMFAGYGSGRASTGATPNMCVLENETKMWVLHAKNRIAGDMGQIHAHRRIVAGDFGAEMITLDERDNDNASRAALLGLAQATGNQGIFAAAGASRSEQTLAVRTNPAYFTAYSLAALRGVNAVYVEAVKQHAPR